MFTQSMSSMELAAEYRADLPEITEFNRRTDSCTTTCNLLRKHHKDKVVGFERIFKTKRNNRYIGVFTYTRSSSPRREKTLWQYDVYTVGLMETAKGTAAVTLFSENKAGIVMQAHFFKRYKERMLAACDWKLRNRLNNAILIEQIIAIYVRRNPHAALMKPNAQYGKRSHLFVPVNDGIALLQYNEKTNTLQANTFVTRDMLSKKQTEWDVSAGEYKSWYGQVHDATKEIFDIINSEENDNKKTEDKLLGLHKTDLINI